MNAPHPFPRIAALLVMALLLCSGAVAAQQTLRCESQDGRYRSCPADTSGGVYLSRQLSQQGCWQGDTWGYDRNRVWVTHGCRAEFRLGRRSSGNNNDAKVAGALVLGTIAAIAIANHNRHDEHHDNSAYDKRYDNRYDYGNQYGNQYDYAGDNWGREFTCASKDGRFTTCNASIGRREHAEIRRQLSDSACRYGQSWGVDRDRVWVDRGCRAVFVVY